MSLNRTALLALLGPLALAGCDRDPVAPPVDTGFAFTYTPPPGAPAVTAVSVRGAFNEWAETPMEEQPDGSWRAAVELDDGSYEYKFFINATWPSDMCHDETWGQPAADYWIDPDAAGCVPDEHGGQNAVVILGDASELLFTHQPDDPAYVSVAGGQLSIRFRARQGQVASAAIVAGDVEVPMHRQLVYGLSEVWRGPADPATGSYSLRVETTEGPETFGPFTPPAEPFAEVPWVGDGVGYQIFPERFWNGDPGNDSATLATDVINYLHPDVHWTVEPQLTEWSGSIGDSHCCHQYFGGDLQGIIDRLDHLEQLGVTMIYMNPIFTSGSAHGYDAHSYMEVAPNFGDTTVLRQLVTAADARGMKLMWDFVPNHTGVGFWAFQDAVKKGESSDYWDWYEFYVDSQTLQAGNGNHYDAWWGFGTLPRLETRNQEVFDHLMAATAYWTEFGLDGIRVDVPFDIRNRAEFFGAFRQAAKAVNPDVYLIGEVWQRDASWLQGDQFDALMNYALGEGVVEPFAAGHLSAAVASQGMAELYALYPEAAAAMLFNLISSHDTARLLTKLGGGSLGGTPSSEALARQRLASAMLYALPGIPVTFQGDECAFLGTADGARAEHRYPFQWDGCDPEMDAHYERLGELRTTIDAFASSVLRSHEASGSVLSFYRGEPGAGEVLVVLNNGAPADFEIPAGTWLDADSGQSVSGTVSLEAQGWRYLVAG